MNALENKEARSLTKFASDMEGALLLIIAACGNPDASTACRLVIKLAKETLEIVESYSNQAISCQKDITNDSMEVK